MHCTTRLNVEPTTHRTVFEVKISCLLPIGLGRVRSPSAQLVVNQANMKTEKPIFIIFFSRGGNLAGKNSVSPSHSTIYLAMYSYNPHLFIFVKRKG